MLKSLSILTPNSIAPSLHADCDKPFGLGFNFMKPFTYKGKTVLISEKGDIFFDGKKLKQYDNGNGYLSVSIKSRLFYVHRLVCEVYHGRPLS